MSPEPRGEAEIARLLGVSRQSLYDVLNEKQPITTSLALRFAKLTGTTPESWARMQVAYDLQVSAVKMVEQIAAIPTLRAA